MPFKDSVRQKEYQRQWQRARRAGEAVGFKVIRVSTPEEIRTANALLTVLAGLIKEVLETGEGDVFIRSRTAGYLISIGLRAVEVANLEKRLTELENKVQGGLK
ncbi:MAG: hypothetical protein AB1597_09465 [Chloroflexota bacterium]